MAHHYDYEQDDPYAQTQQGYVHSVGEYHRPERQASQYNPNTGYAAHEDVYSTYATPAPQPPSSHGRDTYNYGASVPPTQAPSSHGHEPYSYSTSVPPSQPPSSHGLDVYSPYANAAPPPQPLSSHGHDAYSIYDDDKSYFSPHSRANLHDPSAGQYPPPLPMLTYSPAPSSPYGGGSGWSHTGQYGQAKQQLMKRRSVRHVELQQGNLVLDCPVPSSILSYAKDWPGSGSDEFKKMRYTAVTVDPDDFVRSKYTLRPYLYGRKTEIAIVATMYNEDEVLFAKTMTAIVKNIQHFQSRTKSQTWGRNSWQKIVVCIVSDGRKKVCPRVLSMLGLAGCWQDGIAKDTVAGKDVQAHLYEYTTQVVVDENGNVSGGISPVQVLFCLKEQNKKKLNSHRWFLNAFCQQLNPNVCILIDVGTKPSGTSLYHLYKCFDKHPNVGGACGEITVDTGRGCQNLINPLVAAQNFEYKMSNILDKPTESVFGYISVLPGAFSAYRYRALLNTSNGKGPLASYFLGEKMHEPGAKASVFESNMYLAEDRILCFEICTKKREGWVLRYVKSAKASTDVPDRVPEFISQRRRWLNGSFFAAVHASLFFFRIWTSGHSFFRKIWLQIEFLYMTINLFFTWTSLANFYLAIFFVLSAATSVPDNDPFGGKGRDIVAIITNVYIGLMFVIIVCSLGNRPQGSNLAYTGCMLFFAVVFGVGLYCAAWTIWLAVPHNFSGWKDIQTLLDQSAFRDIVISLAATYGLYIFSSLIHTEPWHMITCFIQYMCLLPSYINVLGVYAFCNLHDVSWGTKGQSGPPKDLGGAKKSGKEGASETVEVELPTVPEDINQMWIAMRKELSVKPVEEKSKRDANTKQADHYANYRTNVVLFLIGINMAMVVIFTSQFFTGWVAKETGTKVQTNPYLAFIFYSVAGLSAFRFFGSFMYLLLRCVGH